MSNTITGKLIAVLPLQTGNSAKGTWKHQDFVIEVTNGQYTDKAHFSVWGDDKIASLGNYRVGDMIEVSFDYTSREYNGRWYDEGRAWKIARADEPSRTAPAGDLPGDDASFSPDLP